MDGHATIGTLRRRVHEILEVAKPGDRPSRVVDTLLVVLIGTNVLAVIVESMPSLPAKQREALEIFDIISVAVFTAEYLLRIWSCVECQPPGERRPWRIRIARARTPMAMVDLAAILPFYLSVIFPVDLRFLRVLRLLRVFKLTRYSSAMAMLLNVFRKQAGPLAATLFLLLGLLILTASGIYLMESKAQPEAFGSIPAAMWWSVATLTTTGYGDVIPVTSLGKAFGAVIMLIGVATIAIPAGLLASGFSAEVSRRRRKYGQRMDRALADGILSSGEVAELDRLRHDLDLSEDEVRELWQCSGTTTIPERSGGCCPHCGKSLDA